MCPATFPAKPDDRQPFTGQTVPCALCPVPCALCPVPCALCPVPCAYCPATSSSIEYSLLKSVTCLYPCSVTTKAVGVSCTPIRSPSAPSAFTAATSDPCGSITNGRAVPC